MSTQRIDHAVNAIRLANGTPEDAISGIAFALLDVAAAIREGNSIEVDIAEAIATPGGILDSLAPVPVEDLEAWAARVPGWQHNLLVGLAAIKRSEDR